VTPAPLIAPGTLLGRYEVLEHLASGGMGQVYRARDPIVGRQVAVKLLAVAPDDDRLARFEREVRATAMLAHPNIVTLFDIGTHEGRPFLVYELLDGQTLRQRLASGRIGPETAVELALQLAHGVASAHGLRIVHRDLKPENLFLTRAGTLKVLDFGLAKLRPEVPIEPEGRTLGASSAGMLIGTPSYMAPEQARGAVVDERADIFAIGVILDEMVTGRSPFERASAAETLAAVLRDPPPSAGRGSSAIESALERLIFHCLEKDPADRFQSARDLAFALESLHSEARAGGVTAAGPQPAAERRARSIAVLPFADMSATRDQDYLCEGLAEELINALSQIDGLRVAARSSSFQFRAPAVDVRAAGARLGVDTVLEGGVRKAGDRLRVTVQLVDVNDGYQRWSQRFDRRLEDVFAIQDEIAEAVATALRGILSQHEKAALRRPETAVETYEYFLRGRQLLGRWQRPALEAARGMFERAIATDPSYAPAWAGLADVHCWLYEWWGGDDDDFAAADRASRTALELAPELAEAHASRGFVLSLERRYQEASEHLQEALRLSPNSFDAHYLLARIFFAWGRIEQSVELFRRAGELRVEDVQSYVLLAQSLWMLQRDEEARAANREGIRRAERRIELDPADARALSLGAVALQQDGLPDKALRWSERALELHPDDQGVLLNAACLRARLGRKEEAIAILERSMAKGYGKRDWIENDPDYDNLRDDPRFQAMLDKLH
jgi:non-specific serine/threonine protein kinase